MTAIERAKAIGAWLLLVVCAAALALAVVIATWRSVEAGELYDAAARFQGMHERGNNGSLRRLLGVNPARVPWCGYFLGAVAKRAGKAVPRGYPAARSWTRHGRSVRLSQARRGDIVVLGGRRNHVGLFHGRAKGRVCLLGGNQSNQVKVSCYPANRVRAVRR